MPYAAVVATLWVTDFRFETQNGISPVNPIWQFRAS